MFWEKKSKMEELVAKHMIADLKYTPDWIRELRSVVRRRSDGEQRFDFRVFSKFDAKTKEVKVKDFATLDQHREMILCQGWFDKASGEVHFKEKKAA